MFDTGAMNVSVLRPSDWKTTHDIDDIFYEYLLHYIHGIRCRGSIVTKPVHELSYCNKIIQFQNCEETKLNLHSLSKSFFFLLDDLKEPMDSR